MMKFGICTDFGADPSKDAPPMWDYLKTLGYDHIECGASYISGFPEEEFEAICALCREIGLVVGAVNCFIPGSMTLVGENKTDESIIRAHVCRVFDRMERLGTHTVVFGSGKARTIPEGVSHNAGLAELHDFLRLVAPLAESHGITLVIESLNKSETNVFNNLAETYATVRTLALPTIGMLADSYHMSAEGEPAEIPVAYLPHIGHIHIAEAGSRSYPSSEGGEYVKRMLCRLRDDGYDGSVSVECGMADMRRETDLIMRFLREIGVK